MANRRNILLIAERFLFYVFCLIMVLPIWHTRIFITQDGALHLYNAKVLFDILAGNEDFQSYFHLHSGVLTNWFDHLCLGLLQLFLSPIVSEKIFATSYILSFLFVGRSLLKAIRPGSEFLVYPLGLIGFNFLLQMGFFNFCFSLVFAFTAVFYFVAKSSKNDAGLSRYQSGVLCIFFLVCWFVHPFGFLFSASLVFLLLIWDWFLNKGKGARKELTGILPMIPALILVFVYYLSHSGNPLPNEPATHPAFLEFIGLDSMRILSLDEKPYCILTSVLLVAIALIAVIYNWKSLTKVNSFLWVLYLPIGILLALIIPEGFAGGGFFAERLSVIAFLGFILWIAGYPIPAAARYAVIFVSFFISISILLIRLPHYRGIERQASEYLSIINNIEKGKTLLPLSFAHNGIENHGDHVSPRIEIFRHAADYAGAEKSLVMLDNNEADSSYFPLEWNPKVNPYNYLSVGKGLENNPPEVDIAGYERETGKSIDYIVTWGLTDEYRSKYNSRGIDEQLTANFIPVFRTANGNAVLYRHKPKIR